MSAQLSADVLDLSTEPITPRERFDYWQDVICDVFVKLDAARLVDPDKFTAKLNSVQSGNVRLSRIACEPHQVTRAKRGIARDGEQYYLVNLLMSGRCDALTQDGRTVALGPGDFAVSATSRPYRLRFETAFDMFVFHIPEMMLDGLLPGAGGSSALVVGQASATNALLPPLLENIVRKASTDASASVPHLTAAAVDLVAASLTESYELGSTPSTRTAHLLRAKTYIEEHAGDPELAPAEVAGAASVSPRYLHALFQAEGTTVARYVLARRLAHAARDLVDSRLLPVTVGEIGHRAGFKDASHFTRSFKEKYGVTPREYRSGERS